jgi:hypothetical protein
MKLINCLIFFTCCFLFSSTALGQIANEKEDLALVVFFRAKKFSGGAIQFNVKDSNKHYGQLKNGTIMKVYADPGEHTFFSQVISSDAITLNLEAGNTYYVQGNVKMGALAGRPKFKEVDEKTAIREISKIESN